MRDASASAAGIRPTTLAVSLLAKRLIIATEHEPSRNEDEYFLTLDAERSGSFVRNLFKAAGAR